MRQRKQIHQGYSFFWGVFLLLVMSAAISIHAEAPFMKELVIFKDTLKNDTLVTQSPKKDGTLVIRDRIPIPSNEPLYIVNGLELPYEIFAALNAIYGTRGINGVIVLKLKTPQQMKEEKTIKQIDELLKPRGVDRRNARYYINGKEVPASTAYQTNIEQMEVKTGADGTLEIYIKPMIFIRGEYE